MSCCCLDGEKRRYVLVLPFGTRNLSLEFLDYAAINENSQQSSLYPTRIPSVLPALDSRQCCSNVRGEILDLTAAPRRDFAFQATVSRFSGNAFLADSVENPCLTPSSSTTTGDAKASPLLPPSQNTADSARAATRATCAAGSPARITACRIRRTPRSPSTKPKMAAVIHDCHGVSIMRAPSTFSISAAKAIGRRA